MKKLISKKEKDQIDSICKLYKIENYSINSDGSIDVVGDVNFNNADLIKLPLEFNNVSGDFNCSSSELTSLEGSPDFVGGDYTCSFNCITSLVGGPQTVGGSFYCHGNNITSLVAGPQTVGINYDCEGNTLSNLLGVSTMIGGSLDCSYNNLISTYSGDVDLELISNNVILNGNFLPRNLLENFEHIKLILKYQRHFEIWKDDLSLNVENFADLISEIIDGLK